MFVIAGATGNTGGVAAGALLAKGKPVTVLVRQPQQAEGWRRKGARAEVVSLEDARAVAKALEGAEGAYLLIPPNMKAEDPLAYGFRVGDTLAEAVKASGVPHVVLLSSIGAQHAEGTGPIRSLHHAELALAAAARNATFLRAGYFLQNWAGGLAAVRSQGVLHNFLTPDSKMPMISTSDIGAIAARSLLDPARGRRVWELAGPEEYSPRDIASAFAEALGSPVKLETHPTEGAVPILISMGFPEGLARLYREMVEGINSGHVAYEGKDATLVRGAVTAAECIRTILAEASAAERSGGARA
ncbi:MAG TPA: NmrA family NAD(P)-binding protein [Bryobacteraceae bacterium]|nr:NmrA family NAD(P)-binding protein [Bryobacteraceae bacterium]